MRPGARFHRILSSVFLSRMSVGMVLLALVVGVPLGIEVGQAYKESHAPAPDPGEAGHPSTPTNLAPQAQAILVSRTPTFRWSPAESSSPVRYALQWSVDPQFRTGVEEAVVFGMNATSYVVTEDDAFTPGTTIYWHVVAVDAYQHAGSWSAETSFTTGT